jgi:hypothetical protein
MRCSLSTIIFSRASTPAFVLAAWTLLAWCIHRICWAVGATCVAAALLLLLLLLQAPPPTALMLPPMCQRVAALLLTNGSSLMRALLLCGEAHALPLMRASPVEHQSLPGAMPQEPGCSCLGSAALEAPDVCARVAAGLYWPKPHATSSMLLTYMSKLNSEPSFWLQA